MVVVAEEDRIMEGQHQGIDRPVIVVVAAQTSVCSEYHKRRLDVTGVSK